MARKAAVNSPPLKQTWIDDDLKPAAPKPYYDHAGITIYHGDCRKVLPSIDAVDVTITDPPYGEKTHKGARGGAGDTVLIDFAPLEEADFQAIAKSLVDLSRRWVVMTCEWQHAAKLEAATIPLVRLGVWVKPNGAPQFTGDRPGTGWEAVAILHREGKKRWNGGGHHAVWIHNIEQGQHPTQKPIGLIRKWVVLFSDPGELIFDPYMGSGTTLRAAKDLGRRAIGIEIEERYCEIAANRLAQEVLF